MKILIHVKPVSNNSIAILVVSVTDCICRVTDTFHSPNIPSCVGKKLAFSEILRPKTMSRQTAFFESSGNKNYKYLFQEINKKNIVKFVALSYNSL